MLLKSFLILLIPLIDAFIPRFIFHNPQRPKPSSYEPLGNLLFNPFRKFLPKIYYYKVLPETTVAPTTKNPIELCADNGGFLIKGDCYKYETTAETYVEAKVKCEAQNGLLWTPDIDSTDLYKTIVEAKPGNLFGAQNQQVWIGIRGSNNDITGDDLSTNHLVLTAAAPADQDSNCGVLNWDTGAFYLSYALCDDGIVMKHYVCKL